MFPLVEALPWENEDGAKKLHQGDVEECLEKWLLEFTQGSEPESSESQGMIYKGAWPRAQPRLGMDANGGLGLGGRRGGIERPH